MAAEASLNLKPGKLTHENAIEIKGMNKWFGAFHVLRDIDLTIKRGERVVVCGPSGSGKSTLFRAIAGIWPYGNGQIVKPADAHLMLLPQKPYIPIASLREAITYPSLADSYDDEAIRKALIAAHLPDLVAHLNEVDNWSQRLSGGEQQRLALARALESRGARADLKWPNDLLIGERKVAGILCEVRRLPARGDAVVVGIGVNVGHGPQDLPEPIAATATSLHMAGVRATVEAVAAAFLDAFEPVFDALMEGDHVRVLEEWSARAAFWGRPVTVRTPAGPFTGIARRLDDDGALVLRLESGAEQTVLAGDLVLDAPGGGS